MQLLTGTAHVFRVVTGSAVTVDVFASYIDKSGSTFTPGNQATAITTAATTNVVSAPAASTQRNLKSMSVRNKHASSSNVVTVQFYDGATAYEIISETLAAGTELLYEDGQGWVVNITGANVSHQVFTTGGAGTYTTPAGVRAIKVECVGGGGAGGGCGTAATNSAGAGGGGAGAYAVALITSPAASYAYVVGAGGTPGAAGANNGGAGVNTTFNTTTVVAVGGSGGLADTVTTLHAGGLGGAGGLASGSTGDFKSNGAPGGNGVSFAAAQCLSGAGGPSVYGGGAVSAKNATGAGVAGTSGGGGSGATIVSGGANQAGGAGGAGLIIVTEYR